MTSINQLFSKVTQNRLLVITTSELHKHLLLKFSHDVKTFRIKTTIGPVQGAPETR